MSEGEAVPTQHLFRPLHGSLIELLRGVQDQQWDVACAGRWSVRDVTAHLLDVDVRRISVDRDGHRPPPPQKPITGYADLVSYLNVMNEEWVIAARRLSTQLLVDLLESAGGTLVELMEATSGAGDATYPVLWAGQDRSPMWLDIAREYTERWHHQDQIRDAVGAPPLDRPDLLRPVIVVSLLAVPVSLARVDAAVGAVVRIRAGGDAGGTWYFENGRGGWQPADGERAPTASIACTDLDLARILTHRIRPDAMAAAVRVEGDATLAQAVTGARAVMV